MPQTTQYAGRDDTGTAFYSTRVRCADCGDSRTFEHAGYTPPRNEDVHAFARFHTGTGRYYNRCRDCERTRVAAWRAARATATPPAARPSVTQDARRFGVELELIFPTSVSRDEITLALANAQLHGWRVKSDASLSGNGRGRGWEIVSPPINGENGLAQIDTACRVLRGLGATVNSTCGLHVHHEVRDLSANQIARFVRSWSNNQSVIDWFVSPTRRHNHSYCQRLSDMELRSIERAREISHARVDRYRVVNVNAYARYGTVEVRQHQGTVDAEKIRSWIKLGQAMIEASRDRVIAPVSRVSQFVTALGDKLDDTAGTFLLGRAVRFAGPAVGTAI